MLTTFLLAAALAGAAPHAPDVARASAHAIPGPGQGDSLYLQAREALNRGDYRRAATLFGRVTERAPDSPQAGDAMYWRAFALYRAGGASDLRAAKRLLAAQKDRYPKAATRGDAEALEARIDGQLARGGDAGSAERIASTADSATRRGSCPTSARGGDDGDDDDDEADVRVAALNALMQMDADRALPVLRQVLARRDACSTMLRRKAVFIVSQQRSSETETILLQAASTDPDAEVREQSVFWLGQVRSERAVAALDSILRRGKDQALREKALFALSQQRGDRASATLRAVAEDSSFTGELREQAVFWLGQQRSPENGEYLRQLFARTRSDELREKIMFSLSQMRGVGNDQWLLAVAADPKYSVDVRKQALFSAGQARGPVADLVNLYAKLDDREVKEQLIFVLQERRDPAAVDKLIDLAKNEKDVELRRKAIFWLGQSRDPRVQQLLLDIVNQE